MPRLQNEPVRVALCQHGAGFADPDNPADADVAVPIRKTISFLAIRLPDILNPIRTAGEIAGSMVAWALILSRVMRSFSPRRLRNRRLQRALVSFLKLENDLDLVHARSQRPVARA